MSKPLITQGASPPDSSRVFGPGAKALRAGLYACVSTHDQKTLPMQLDVTCKPEFPSAPYRHS